MMDCAAHKLAHVSLPTLLLCPNIRDSKNCGLLGYASGWLMLALPTMQTFVNDAAYVLAARHIV